MSMGRAVCCVTAACLVCMLQVALSARKGYHEESLEVEQEKMKESMQVDVTGSFVRAQSEHNTSKKDLLWNMVATTSEVTFHNADDVQAVIGSGWTDSWYDFKPIEVANRGEKCVVDFNTQHANVKHIWFMNKAFATADENLLVLQGSRKSQWDQTSTSPLKEQMAGFLENLLLDGAKFHMKVYLKANEAGNPQEGLFPEVWFGKMTAAANDAMPAEWFPRGVSPAGMGKVKVIHPTWENPLWKKACPKGKETTFHWSRMVLAVPLEQDKQRAARRNVGFDNVYEVNRADEAARFQERTKGMLVMQYRCIDTGDPAWLTFSGAPTISVQNAAVYLLKE